LGNEKETKTKTVLKGSFKTVFKKLRPLTYAKVTAFGGIPQ